MRDKSTATAFEKAVKWLIPIYAHQLEQPGFRNRPLVATELLLRAEWDIWPETPGGPHLMSEAAAIHLYAASKTDAGAYDLLRTVCVGLLLHDRYLELPLRLFVTSVLTDTARRPKAAKAALTYEFNFFNLIMALSVSQNFSLSLTRNVASQPLSACDALSVAFDAAATPLGRNRSGSSYSSLRKLFEARYQYLRTDAARILSACSKYAPDELKRLAGTADIFDLPAYQLADGDGPTPEA